MKTKSLSRLMHNIILCIVMLLVASCAEEGIDLAGAQMPLLKTEHSCQWSVVNKKDTTILFCFENVNISDINTNITSKGIIKFYKQKDTVYFDNKIAPDPIYRTKTTLADTQKVDASTTLHTTKKEFFFEDGEIVYVDASFYSKTLEYNGKSINLPHVSISSIDYINNEISPLNDGYKEYLATLEFALEWEVEGKISNDIEKVYVEYIKIASDNEDELLNTSYNQSINWTNDKMLRFYVEKIEDWSVSGQKRYKYTSPLLDVTLSKSEYKTLEVTNFDFSKELLEEVKQNENLGQDNWNISKKVITKTLRYTNNSETFEDVFSYPEYDVSFKLDDKNFTFNLDVSFIVEDELSTVNDTHKSNKTTAKLKVASKEFEEDVVTVLKLKEKEDPLPPEDEPVIDDVKKHGRIITHHVSAIYDVANSKTKKCVIIRYEEGYDWGICEYEEYFPSTFTYTQTGYSGFNSVAQSSKTAPFKLARVKEETSNALYWYQEDGKLISAIDFLSCKAIGWKHEVNGVYKSIMNGYEESYSRDKYTLTLTAPNGTKKTFKSSKSD